VVVKRRIRRFRGRLDSGGEANILLARRSHLALFMQVNAGGRGTMSGKIEARLKELGLELPAATAPIANYVPFTRAGNLVIVSGQVSVRNGKPEFVGKLGRDITVADAQQAAKLCALNIIAHLKTACDGDLDRVKRVLRLGGFVNCTPEFTDMPQVVNGASDLMVQVFGDAGKHARAAVGVSSLPLGVAVEVEAMFELA
jgi:enamine deaminase RidA (YjgF/YER057c/UK114 family)